MNVAVSAKHLAASKSTVWGVRLEPNGHETWDRYELGKLIASGGMGAVHELFPEFRPPLVAKLFGDGMLTRMKGDPKIAMRLAALVRNRSLIANELAFATWPRRMLFWKERPRGKDEITDTIIGFTMPRLDGTISLHELLMAEDRRLRLTPDHTAFIAISLADQLNRLHRHKWGFVFGDLSPNNVHVSTDFKAVTFIDTDSFQFEYQASKYSFTLEALTKGYKSPGADAQLKKAGRLTAAHDDFVLAILIFELLMMNRNRPRHPFQTMKTPLDTMISKRAFPFDDPQTYRLPAGCLEAYKSYPEPIRQAFTRTFTTPSTVTAEEWTVLLTQCRRFLRQ
jgi:DNA-binding helix-hairpin-helix protein with protein kinase domain